MTADRDDLAAIIIEATDEWDDPVSQLSADWLADVVLESDWLRGLRAGTWDECFESGTPWENPYRADRADNTTDRTYKIPD